MLEGVGYWGLWGGGLAVLGWGAGGVPHSWCLLLGPRPAGGDVGSAGVAAGTDHSITKASPRSPRPAGLCD